MSQVISIWVPKQFHEEVCTAFQKEIDLGSANGSVEHRFHRVFPYHIKEPLTWTPPGEKRRYLEFESII